MSCVRLASLLVIATVPTVTLFAAEVAPADSVRANTPAPTPPALRTIEPPKGVSTDRGRAISPAIAAQFAAAVNKIDVPGASSRPDNRELPDLREIDKPRNTILRLPAYTVREAKPRIFKEQEIQTPRARIDLAYKKFPGLRVGSFWIFSNDGIASAMLAEEERLEQKREFEDLVSLMRFTSPAAHAKSKREVDQAFVRKADFGR